MQVTLEIEDEVFYELEKPAECRLLPIDALVCELLRRSLNILVSEPANCPQK